MRSNPLRRIAVPAGAAFLLALLASCKDERIQRYRVVRSGAPAAGDPAVTSPNEPRADSAHRLLGALVAHGGMTWFFKLSGPAAAVSAEKDRFDLFVRSLTFDGSADRPVRWTAPEGWVEEAGAGLRRATLRPAAGGSRVELSVTAFPGDAGGTLKNVNRWRDQIGLLPIGEEELAAVAPTVEVAGKKVFVVDLAGHAPKGGPMGGPMAGPAGGPEGRGGEPIPPLPPGHPVVGPEAPVPPMRPEPPEGTPPGPPVKPSFVSPAEWKPLESGGFRLAAFQAGPEGRPAEVTVIPLGGAAGGELENVNRWRTQVGLGPLDAAVLAGALKKIEVEKKECSYADVAGPEASGADRLRILAVIVPQGASTFFIKMTGPASTIEEERARFESFVRSIKFAAGPAGDQ